MGAHTQRAAAQRWLHPWGLTEEWIAFLAQMDDLFERLARARREPYRRLTADDLRAVATLAVALGIRPEEVARVGVDERELTLGGVG
ncbi:MAG: hypothetical protein C4290_11010 [Chloroflexota bacterium]